jgi:hypothetical protein
MKNWYHHLHVFRSYGNRITPPIFTRIIKMSWVFLTKSWIQCVELNKCPFPCLAGAKQKEVLFGQVIL